ncbi:putative restriction endonuclease [Nocardia tenerifensis]|uniref:Putative restriction endonuclease n=1 Tax=Nocardia tenerifensis TaxID=228006 RepID=A0A318KKE5_9NOCA|nr:Uma2 family endonuclease [Nocardia tenerifensis]PXX68867.1 putative restriction endonuclease [Nocardia tenerifensis]
MSAVFDWAKEENLQPAPITVRIWQGLPESFCRLVEVVNGEAVRAESPTRSHQKAARRIADMIETAAEAHGSRDRDVCLDVGTNFDVLLWQDPHATIRRPDIALYECAPEELRPLPASAVKLVVEVTTPGTEKVDIADKKAEYALAGIPWYWIARLADNRISAIQTHVLDHAIGQYRPHILLEPISSESVADLPIRISIDWQRLSRLAR